MVESTTSDPFIEGPILENLANVILIGGTGNGKSATANSLAGQEIFTENAGSSAVPISVKLASCDITIISKKEDDSE